MDESDSTEFEVALATHLQPLVSLLEQFIDGHVDGDTFDRRFFEIYQRDEVDAGASTSVYRELERFFAAVDDHVPDVALRDGPEDLTTEELRSRAAALLTLAGLRHGSAHCPQHP